jgi:8-oxo-dGTP pyrophosphatase MutT (NUDIX family)
MKVDPSDQAVGLNGMRESEVAIFVTRRGRSEVLIAHRSPQQGSYWHTIAGGIEGGETPLEAAARELAEETGLTGVELVAGDEIVEYAYALSEEPPERLELYADGLLQVRVHCFVAEAPDHWEPTLDWEHDDHRWCAPADAADTLRWPETADALRRLLLSP